MLQLQSAKDALNMWEQIWQNANHLPNLIVLINLSVVYLQAKESEKPKGFSLSLFLVCFVFYL